MAVLVGIGARQAAFLAVLVIEVEGTVELQVVLGVAKAAIAVAVPQDAVAVGAQHHGHAHLGIILEQVLVLALHVEFARLVLSQAIERLILVLELERPGQALALIVGQGADADFALGHLEWLERLTAHGLSRQDLAALVGELDAAVGLVDGSRHVLGLDAITVAIVGDRELGLGRLRHNHQAGRLGRQLCLAGGLHAHDVVVHHLQAYHAGGTCLSILDVDCHEVAFGLDSGLCHSGIQRNCRHQKQLYGYFHLILRYKRTNLLINSQKSRISKVIYL